MYVAEDTKWHASVCLQQLQAYLLVELKSYTITWMESPNTFVTHCMTGYNHEGNTTMLIINTCIRQNIHELTHSSWIVELDVTMVFFREFLNGLIDDLNASLLTHGQCTVVTVSTSSVPFT